MSWSIVRGLPKFAAVLAVLGTSLGAEAQEHRVTVRGTTNASGETPVVAELKSAIEPGAYVLEGDGGVTLPANVFLDAGKSYLGVVLPGTSEAPATYRLRKANGSAADDGVKFVRKGANIHVMIDGKPFTEYLTDAGPKPYYFPVIGPNGKRITRAFPMEDVSGEKRDHPHQRSFWFTHGKVNGIDFWSELKGHGSIKETSKVTAIDGPALGLIRTTDDWIGPDGKKVCEDERVVRIWDAKATRVVDFDITIKATAGPVTFGDTKEGMFGVRVATSMDVNSKLGGKIFNSAGQIDDAAWGKPAAWVDYTGPVDGETVGVAILNHPESFRHPTTWHVRTYGLFAANPFGWKDFGMKQSGDHTIPAGETMRLRYRVILHKGATPGAGIPDAYSSYASPPAIEVTAN